MRDEDGAEQGAALAWFLASRRDALLLLLLAAATVAWTWERGALAALLGALVTAALFVLMMTLVRPAFAVYRQLDTDGPEARSPWLARAARLWVTGLLGLSGLATTLLVARAAAQSVAPRPLVGLVALLTVAWQVWLYLWTAAPPEVKEE